MHVDYAFGSLLVALFALNAWYFISRLRSQPLLAAIVVVAMAILFFPITAAVFGVWR